MPEQMMILIIEDDPDIRRTVEMHLVSLGYAVETASDGKIGLEKAKACLPDLVVLDLGLPEMPGEEVCRELKKDEAYRGIPVIMVTAKGTDVDRVVGRVIGADWYISKPFDLDTLETKIKELLAKAPARRVPRIDRSRCTGCGVCIGACPKKAIHP